jgi:hypothetical protein
MVRIFLLLISLVLVSNPVPIYAGQNKLSQQLDKFDLAAEAIVEALVKNSTNDQPAIIFFAPFHSGKGIPIARPTANLFFTRFEKSIQKHSPPYFKFKRSDDQRIQNDKQFKESKYLLTSELVLRNRDLTITFRAQRDGLGISTYTVTILDLPPKDLELTKTLSMPDGISQAAQKFSDYGKAPSETGALMKKLYWDYLSDGAQGNSTSFGRAFMKKLVIDIQESFTDPLTRKQLITKRVSHSGKTLKKGVFSLSGSVELSGDRIDVYLELSDRKNQVVSSWSGLINRSTTRNLTYEGRSNANALKELKDLDKIRAIQLKLAIPKAGKSNTLAIGEEWNLEVFVNKPSWLYCYYYFTNKHGPESNKTIMIYPNPATWSDYKTPKIPSQKVISIPRSTYSENKQKVTASFTTSPPVGTELVKCFASQKDITMDLPEPLRGKETDDNSIRPLPDQMGSMLRDIFLAADPMISEASVLVTVIKTHLK